MAAKIILFLSKLGDGREQEYRCPDGGTATGSQTNEAPVKYLLRAWPDVSVILSIVTPEAEDAREWFQAEIQEAAPRVRIHEIPYDGESDFIGGPLKQILGQVSAGDEILLETTGGFRNAVMDLLLISRVLTYVGARTAGAVYSNYYKAQVEDVTHLIDTFDLIGGMQEFTSFGSTRTLRAFYGAPAEDARIERLLCAVERLRDSITLCRTGQLDARLEEFEAALEDAENCDDAMMRALLPAFRKKYGKKLTILGLISWCVDSDMLQQALTLYKERIPVYLLKNRTDLLELKRGAPADTDKEYLTVEESRFVKQFIDMGRGTKEHNRLKRQIEKLDAIPFALEELKEQLPYSHFSLKCTYPQFLDIATDYFYIRALRNMTNHANDTVYAEYLEQFLTGRGYPPYQDLTSEKVKAILKNALEHFRKENYR